MKVLYILQAKTFRKSLGKSNLYCEISDRTLRMIKLKQKSMQEITSVDQDFQEEILPIDRTTYAQWVRPGTQSFQNFEQREAELHDHKRRDGPKYLAKYFLQKETKMNQ